MIGLFFNFNFIVINIMFLVHLMMWLMGLLFFFFFFDWLMGLLPFRVLLSIYLLAVNTSPQEPKFFFQAIKDPFWRAAMDKEI